MIHKMVEEEKSSVVMAVTTPEDPQESSKEQVEQLILSEQEEVTQPPTSTTTTTTTTTMPEEQLHIEAEKPEEEQTAVTVPESTVEEPLPLPLPLPEAATTRTATTTATQSIGEEKGEKATTTSEEKKPQEPSDSTTGPDEPEKPLELQMEPIEAERQQQQQQQQSASSLSTAAADEEKVTLTTTAAANKFPQRRGSAVTMTTTVKFIPPRQRRGSDLTDKVAMFNKKFTEHHEKQLANPFSDIERPEGYQFAKLDPSDPNYGKPVAGSMTELRGKKANQHMRKEWRTLCEVIYDCGYRLGDGKAMIRFGELFTMYNAISDKCVGNLLGARKHGYLTFEGEMLYQRRDEDTEITLLKPIKEIQALLPIIFDPSLPDNLQE